MTLDVFLVDKTTRLFLAPTMWGFTVRERLSIYGHQVEYVGSEPQFDDRSPEELARRDALLEEIHV